MMTPGHGSPFADEDLHELIAERQERTAALMIGDVDCTRWD